MKFLMNLGNLESSLESKINTNNFSRLCELEAKYNDRSFERRLKFFFRSKKIFHYLFQRVLIRS